MTGMVAFSARGSSATTANLAATACYAVATLLVYGLLKPVNRNLSMLAAFFSLVGCALSVLVAFHLGPFPVNPLVFFGLHCLLVGYLIFRSTFLPQILGVLLALGGLGWLTFASPELAKQLTPFNMIPGFLAELALSLWLLAVGVNVPRWEEKARGYYRTGTSRLVSRSDPASSR
jgi:hypothetical protein